MSYIPTSTNASSSSSSSLNSLTSPIPDSSSSSSSSFNANTSCYIPIYTPSYPPPYNPLYNIPTHAYTNHPPSNPGQNPFFSSHYLNYFNAPHNSAASSCYTPTNGPHSPLPQSRPVMHAIVLSVTGAQADTQPTKPSRKRPHSAIQQKTALNPFEAFEIGGKGNLIQMVGAFLTPIDYFLNATHVNKKFLQLLSSPSSLAQFFSTYSFTDVLNRIRGRSRAELITTKLIELAKKTGKSLRRIDVSDVPEITTDHLTSLSSVCSGLTALSISPPSIGTRGMPVLGNSVSNSDLKVLLGFQNLTCLDVSYTNITDEVAIGILTNNPNLTKLDIFSCIKIGKVFFDASPTPQLKELRLGSTKLENSLREEDLCSLPNMKLTSLHVTTQESDHILKILKYIPLSITHLKLDSHFTSTSRTDGKEGKEGLAKLATLVNLISFELKSFNPDILASLSNLPVLSQVRLRNFYTLGPRKSFLEIQSIFVKTLPKVVQKLSAPIICNKETFIEMLEREFSQSFHITFDPEGIFTMQRKIK